MMVGLCSPILLLITLLIKALPTQSESTASFGGNDYIEYKITDTSTVRGKDKVMLRFKTTEAYGILLYSCGEQGDFLLLEIKRGKIVYTGDFGSTEHESGTHQIILDQQYNDNKWHDITLLRENGTHVSLTVDDVKNNKIIDNGFEQLNLDTYLYVGGFGKTQRLDTSCHSNIGKKNFIGCLENVRFNSIDLLYGAIEKFTSFQIYGNLLFSCPNTHYDIFGFDSETSLLTVKRDILKQKQFELVIELRTFEPNGHILTHLCTNGAIDLDIISGTLRLTLSFLGLATNNAVRVVSTTKINDGDWHVIKIAVNRNESVIMMNVDAEKKEYKFPSHFKLSIELGWFTSSIRLGGNTPALPGLVSCYRQLVIDNNKISINSTAVATKNEVSDQCQIKDLCFPNPCRHGSTCSQSRQKAYCNCENKDYVGTLCETCAYKRSCQEIKDSGESVSGNYKICPNNERPFHVYCNMESGETIIKHNTVNNTHVGDGKQIGTSKSSVYVHSINYFAPMKSIVDLLSVSKTCQQYIRFDCKNSRLLFDVGNYRYVHYKGARWWSRDSVLQHYWGGATQESRKCGCGMDGSCAKDTTGKIKDCNCDVDDSLWHFDAGYLTDKSLLPVTAVQFSKGPETNEKSFFTVGELKCHGTIPLPTSKPIKNNLKTQHNNISNVDYSMFYNQTHYRRRNNITDDSHRNVTILIEKVQAESLDSLFSKPWLITVVAIGAVLCLLLVFLVFLLFRQQISSILMKCIYGKNISKPRIEIEDYNRYSTGTEYQSDWDIYRLSTTFPTSTPDPSYGPTDDESNFGMRVRTLEDVRGKKRFKRLSGWGSRTASAPTVVGRSKQSLNDKYQNFSYQKESQLEAKSSRDYHASTDSKPTISPTRSLSADTEAAYSTTATDGEVDSVIDDTNSEFSQQSRDSSMKESECALSSSSRSKYLHKQSSGKSERPNDLRLNEERKAKGLYLPAKNGQLLYKEPSKAFYPVVPINGYKQPLVRRAQPVEYSTHVQMKNNNGPHFPINNTPVTRLMSVNRRPSVVTSDNYPLYAHSTIQEKGEEYSEEDDIIKYDSARNSDGFYDMADHEHGSPSSETRLLFDDASSREECEREADEKIKLLKQKVIEKATSADECG